MQLKKLNAIKKPWKIISLCFVFIVLIVLICCIAPIINDLPRKTMLNRVEDKLKSDCNLILYPDELHPKSFVRPEVASNEPAVYSDITISFDDAYQKAVDLIETCNLNEDYPYELTYPLPDELADEPRRDKKIPFALAEFDCLYNYWLFTFKIQAPDDRLEEIRLKFIYTIGVDDGGILFVNLS